MPSILPYPRSVFQYHDTLIHKYRISHESYEHLWAISTSMRMSMCLMCLMDASWILVLILSPILPLCTAHAGPRSSCRHGKHPVGHAGPETFWLTSCRIQTDTLDTSWNEWNMVKNWFGFRTISIFKLLKTSFMANKQRKVWARTKQLPTSVRQATWFFLNSNKSRLTFALPICTLRTNETPQRILFLCSAKQHIFEETLARWTIEPKTNYTWNGLFLYRAVVYKYVGINVLQ